MRTTLACCVARTRQSDISTNERQLLRQLRSECVCLWQLLDTWSHSSALPAVRFSYCFSCCNPIKVMPGRLLFTLQQWANIRTATHKHCNCQIYPYWKKIVYLCVCLWVDKKELLTATEECVTICGRMCRFPLAAFTSSSLIILPLDSLSFWFLLLLPSWITVACRPNTPNQQLSNK